jgi:hypothetical protein
MAIVGFFGDVLSNCFLCYIWKIELKGLCYISEWQTTQLITMKYLATNALSMGNTFYFTLTAYNSLIYPSCVHYKPVWPTSLGCGGGLLISYQRVRTLNYTIYLIHKMSSKHSTL